MTASAENDQDYLCPCYKKRCTDCPKGFEKVLDLEKPGLVIYRHSIKPEEAQNIGYGGNEVDENGFIFHNTKDTDIISEDFLPEMEKRALKCARCRQIMEHAVNILKRVSIISKNEIIGICNHCKLKDHSCCECKGTLKEFFERKKEAKEFTITKDRVKEWLVNVQSQFKGFFANDKDTRKERLKDYINKYKDTDKKRLKARSEVQIDHQLYRRDHDRSERDLEIRELYRQSDEQSVAKPSLITTDKSKKQILFKLEDQLEVVNSISTISFHRKTKSAASKTIQPLTLNEDRIYPISKKDKYGKKDDGFTEKPFFILSGTQGREYYENEILPPTQFPHDTEKQRAYGEEPIDDTQQRGFVFSFPFEIKTEEKYKQDKSSSELINDIHDRIQVKHEEERLKKILEEETKQRAQENKIKIAQEKKRLAEEKKVLKEEKKLKEKQERELHRDDKLLGKSKDTVSLKDKTSKTSPSTTTQKIKQSMSEVDQRELKTKSQVLRTDKELKMKEKEFKSDTKLKPKPSESSKRLKSDQDSSKLEHKKIKSVPDTESKQKSGSKYRKSETEGDYKQPKADLKQPLPESKQPKTEPTQSNADSKQPKPEPKPPKAEQKEPKSEPKADSKQPKAELKPPQTEQKQPITDSKQPKFDQKSELKQSDLKQTQTESKETKNELKQPKSVANADLKEPKAELIQPKTDLKESKTDLKQSKAEAKPESKEPKADLKQSKSESKEIKADVKKPKVEKEFKDESKQVKPEAKTESKQSKPELKSTQESLKPSPKEAPGSKKSPPTQTSNRLETAKSTDQSKGTKAESKQSKSEPKDAKHKASSDTKGAKDEPKADKVAEKPDNETEKRGKNVIAKAEHDAEKAREKEAIAAQKIAEPIKPKEEEPMIKHGKDIKPRDANEPRIPRRQLEAQLLAAQQGEKKPKHKKKVFHKEPGLPSRVLDLRTLSQIMTPSQIYLHGKEHKIFNAGQCPMCMNSNLELEFESKKKISQQQEMIKGNKIKRIPAYTEDMKDQEVKPILFQIKYDDKFRAEMIKPPKHIPVIREYSEELKPIKTVNVEESKGVIRYALSDRTFIEKGWTMLPTEKVVRKMNVYRMRPAHPEFDWFEHNRNKRLMTYDTGERLAEFDDDGRGRWYYRNQRLALQYYDTEELNAQQRFVIYSNGEPDERGRTRPYTILATFDFLGNGIVFDHGGKIRMKYNQTEGVVLDRNIGPVSNWKWHTLNDPPVLQQVMIDTHMAYKDPEIIKMGTPRDDVQPRRDNEDMLAIEFDNFIKEKGKKLSQTFKPFQIRMKALKINEHFSLKVLDQANVYLIYRDGTTNIKLNLGMLLDNKEIVDTDTAEVGEVANNMERLPARTDSLAAMQKSVAYAQHFERTRTERERRLQLPVPSASVDKLTVGASRPLRPPLRAAHSSTGTQSSYSNSRKPPPCNIYYDNRLL